MNKILLVSLPIIVGIGAIFFSRGMAQETEEIHYHAAFQVLDENSIALDFSGDEYMSITPCAEGDEGLDSHPKEIDMHDGVGDVVHVHGGIMYWQDLMEYLKLDKDDYIAVINDIPRSDYALVPIAAYDSAVFMIKGDTIDSELILSLPDEEYIQEVEQLSGTCAT